MKKLFSLLRSKTGFTLVEVSVSSAVMLSMISIFSLIPIYKAQLSTVTVKEKATAIAEEAISQIDNIETSADPVITLDGTSYTIEDSPATSAAIPTQRTYTSANNINFNAYVESYNIDVLTDNDGDAMLGDESSTNEGTNTCKISVAVAWQGSQCGNVSREHVITNSSINHANGARATNARVGGCQAQASRNRCYCSAGAASCSKTSCRCQT